VLLPERRGEHHEAEAGEADQRRERQVAHPEPEAVAEDHPEVDRVERRRHLAAHPQAVGEQGEVQEQSEHPPRRRHARPVQDVAEKHHGDAAVEAEEDAVGAHQRVGVLEAELARDHEVGEHHGADDDPVDRHLVLAVRPAAQAPGDQVAQPRRGYQKVSHRGGGPRQERVRRRSPPPSVVARPG
jgi:hypothetical protein